jgi:hypothetical protein
VRAAGATAMLTLAMVAAGCGDEQGSGIAPDTGEEPPATTTATPIDPAAASEASPESGGEGEPDTSELAPGDRDAVEEAARAYVAALDDRDGAAVCAAIRPGGLRVDELPVRRGGCAASLEASIGHRRPSGLPAWKRTDIVEVTAVSVGEGAARVTATVTHSFADRKYTSIEEDVIYLDDAGGGNWLLAKPSLTLYRAVGYPDPPLRALTPP